MPQFDPEKQREFALEVVRTLRAQGYTAYWAGGCVRDRLLGRQPKDYDVGTSATPDQVRDLFGHRRTVAVGAQFGVINVVGRGAAGHVEVATFRRDSTYSDGRHPDSVEFSTPEADAQRRDFTINGLFYDPVEDRVIDFVGGVDDLGRGIVRAIGEPRARFEEDKLRLLRAVRFTATYDFRLDMPTLQAVEAMAEQLPVVSVERIAGEMRLMLVHSRRVQAVDLLRDVGLLAVILPEFAAANDPRAKTLAGRAGNDAWLTTLEVLGTLVEPTFPLALAALLHAFVDAQAATLVGRRWKLSNQEIARTNWLVEHQKALESAGQLLWSQLQPLLSAEGAVELVALERALALAAGRTLEHVEYCQTKLALPALELDPPPLITGDDLIIHGVPRGKRYQWLLQAVRDAQLDGHIHAAAQALALVDRLRSE